MGIVAVQIFVIGYPIGLLLKRRIFSESKLAGLGAFVYGFTLEFLMYNEIFIMCQGWATLPIPVGCAQFLPMIFGSLIIGLVGIVVIIYYVNKENE